MTCCLLLVWGVVSSAGWAEHEWVGLGVLSIAMAWGLAFNFHLRANTVSAFRAVQHHITFRMLEQNEKRAMHVALRKELGVPLILGSLATTNGGTTASTTSTTSTTSATSATSTTSSTSTSSTSTTSKTADKSNKASRKSQYRPFKKRKVDKSKPRLQIMRPPTKK